MALRDAAPISREQWLLPLLVAGIVAFMEILRLLGHPIAGAGAIVTLAIIYTAYRAGIVPAMIAAGCLSIYVIRSYEAGLAVPSLGVVIVLFGSSILIGWLSMQQRRALRVALSAREQSLRSEQRYRDLVDGLDAVVWEADADTYQVLFISKHIETVFGYSCAEWVGSSRIWQRFIHPDDFARVVDSCRAAAAEGRDHDLVYRAITRSGEIMHVRDIVHMDSSVLPPVLRGIIFDVTREHTALTALRDTEHKLRAFINNAPDALLVLDVTGKIVEVNRRACDSLGYTRAEMVVMRLPDVDAEVTDAIIESWGTSLLLGPVMVEGLFRRSDGSTMPVEVALSVWEAEPQLFIAVARDITHKTQLEEQLRQAQRMEAVGRLAGGIAHDFNNLLTAIRGHANLLQSTVDVDGRSDLEQIEHAADRAAALTRQLLAFSRQQLLTLQVLDLNSIVLETHKLYNRLIGENITMVTALDPKVPPVEADRTQLEQVLMNLVLNARDAMPNGGQLKIRTAPAILNEIDADRFAFVRPGNYALLSVADSGTGMDAETVKHIFDPFFTTKEQGKGSGLGLATAYGIVKQLGGYIWCDTSIDAGTTFRVYLPPATAGQPATASNVRRVQQMVRRGDETILVVEDEPAVRSLVRRVLQNSGYRVIDASNGVEALRVVQDFSEPIHLLLTDLIMPEMGGRDLAEHLGPQRPGMKILFMSGYAEDAIVINHVLQPGLAFLPKPFAPDALAAKVRETLES